MIQYYLDLMNQVEEINQEIHPGSQIQKIYSTAYFVSLAIRSRGQTHHLFLGRGGGFEGIWLHDSPPPSELRRRDNFLEYLRRHLSSCSFLDVSLDHYDRILRLDYQKFGEKQSFLFFWKARKMYFVHLYKDAPESPPRLLMSWRGKAIPLTEDAPDFFTFFDEVGRSSDIKHDLLSKKHTSIADLISEEQKAASLKGLDQSPTFLQRKKENILDDLRKAKQWERLQSILDKQEPLEGIYELKVDDQKIKFEGQLNPYERRNLLHQKIKKLKRGENILRERLGSVNDQLEGKETLTRPASTLPIIKPVWGKDEKFERPELEKPASMEFKVFHFNDYEVGVGLSSQGNDQLRNKWAGKEDTWIHLDGLKSSHVIVKGGSVITPEMMNTAATILAHFSHFQDDWIPVIYTQVKNLKGVSGSPGMVIYKKEKHLRCPKLSLDFMRGIE